MKINVGVLCAIMMVFFLTSCKAQKANKIIVSNKSSHAIKDKVISLPWSDVKQKYPSLDINSFRIVDITSKKEVPYQLEFKGNENVQNVLIQVSLDTKTALELQFENKKHIDFVTKTFGRYVPERLDDFAWENDKIAFRMYGKALEEGGKGNAYGIDVWVKRTNEMIINKRYKLAKYHVDHGDGLDYYHVGFTLGAGNMAPFVNDSIWYSKNYTKWKILDNGPLRTTFQLEFDEWDVNGNKMDAVKTISLDAGSQLNRIDVKYTTNNKSLEQIPVVVGIIKRPESGFHSMDIENGVLGYWEPKDVKYGTTGVGVIIPSKVDDMTVRNDQFLVMLKIPNNQHYTYYTGAVWDKAGDITNKEEWFQYLNEMKLQLLNDNISIQF
ncbi:DUF4861 family protein [Siansivirga zeaxanthinifaciens]|uniref:DUF4861 domain-containing protein n=1 Tax=Siansivirga zeaxanthinifaciens CC-SAMT-1 TaxID=1454006 RepID=A0A0C5VZG3_9FLAO|nr:DUF4861 family protein [Siansivirga zeaxanthinifaciens]AJR04461.1 hypothetical protein AW14_13155 [Siansivirga zeaxanthinifaciens CC-SAMT-1]